MKKVNIIVCIMSGLGLALSTGALVFLLVRGEPFLPEYSISALIEHPLVWAIISGTIFFPAFFQLRNKKEK